MTFPEPDDLLRRSQMTTHPVELRLLLQEACDEIRRLRTVNEEQAAGWAATHDMLRHARDPGST